MNILIIGGTKFVGKAIAKYAAAKGHEVTLFNRGMTDSNPAQKVLTGDVDQILEHREALQRLSPDVVIHAIAYTEHHSNDLIEVFSGMHTRIIALGSQDCYEAFYQINHGGDIAEMPISENAQTCLKKYYWQDRPGLKKYEEYDKNLMTDALMVAHNSGKITATVLRIGMVFGPDDYQFQHRHGKIIRRVYDKQPVLTLGSVEQAQLFSYTYVDNVAAAVIHAAEHTAAAGRVFNIGERKSRSFRRWAELYGQASGMPFQFSILPDALIENDVNVKDNPPRLILMDTSAFTFATGFQEPITLDEQISKTLAWGLAHPDALGPQPDYSQEQSKQQAYQAFLYERS